MTDEPSNPRQALPRLLLEHRDALFAYIVALVRNWSAAEELFQEVSLVVLQKAQEGTAVGRFGPWSREIARRMVLNYWKTSTRSRLVLSAAAIETLDRTFALHDDEQESGDYELLQSLRRCMKRLPEHLRKIVDLRYQETLSLEEIARRLNRSSGAVQVALSRIRTRLLECTKRLQTEQGVSPA